MKKYAHTLPVKLGALLAVGMLTAACTDQQQRSTEQNMDRAGERTETLYNDIRTELRDARERGRICASAYEGMREEWREHTDDMDTDRADDSWREQMSEWGDELGDMFDDMGDIVDRNC